MSDEEKVEEEVVEEEEGAGQSQEEDLPQEETSEEETSETEYKLEDGYIVYPDGNKIPVDRFEKVYGQGKEHERKSQEAQEKLTLLQTNPEEYYRKFPVEKPLPAAEHNIGDMVVTGGEYEGMTLSELYRNNPIEAQRMQFDYMTSQKEASIKAESEKTKSLADANAEIDNFGNARAQDFFKKDMSALTAAEFKQVNELIGKTINWGKETGRGGGNLEDMYFLMNKKALLSQEQGAGIRSLLNGQVNPVPSIASGGHADSGKETGYALFARMNDDQLAVAIDGMSDSEYMKFKKDAPDELKRKFSSIPW